MWLLEKKINATEDFFMPLEACNLIRNILSTETDFL